MENAILNNDESPNNSPKNLLENAKTAFRAGRLKRADKDLTHLLSLGHATQIDIVAAFLLRGSVRMAEQKLGEAVQDWKAVLRMEPFHKEAMTHLYGEKTKRNSNHEIERPLPLVPSSHSSPKPSLRSPLTTSTLLTGKIRVFQRNTGAFVGYVTFKEQKYCLITKKSLAATIISAQSIPTPFALTIVDATDMYPFLGFVSASLPDGQEYAVLTRTGHTAPHDPPTAAGNLVNMSSKVESSVWTYNPTNNRLTPQWINANGNKQATRLDSLCYSAHHKALFLPEDFPRYKSVVPDIFLVEFALD